ncbi:hypothetical protein PIB30_069129 [Stylosanthes scabra]|uniref:Uncharacterized protein n=1 Tax=Stylosanthes scabra TaxID=79078 RepID=A0ABU6RP13_9FABA|nr:hypothetical protein [Stylosanthes scabra]
MFQQLGRIFEKDRATGSTAVSGLDAEEQVEEEPNDDEPVFDDCIMSSTPTADGLAQTQGNAGMEQDPRLIMEHLVEIYPGRRGSKRTSWKGWPTKCRLKGSTKNEEVKMGEKLAELGFADHEVIQAVIKICSDPRLEKSFWGLTDAQKTTLAQDVLDRKVLMRNELVVHSSH